MNLYAFNGFRFGHHAVHGAGNVMHINIWQRLPNEVLCPEQKNERKSSKNVKPNKKKNACIFVLNFKLF